MPFIFNGTITDINTTTALASAKVIAKNITTTPGNTTVNTDSDGLFVLDLANMANGFSVGDEISVSVRRGNKARVRNFTITQAMIDGGGHTLNISVYGLRKHLWLTVQGLYLANIPTGYTVNGTAFTWTITSAFPESSPAFPVIVIEPVRISPSTADIDGSEGFAPFTMETMFYANKEHHKGVIDNARDFMQQVLEDNEEELNYAGIYFGENGNDNEWIDDSTIAELEFNDQVYNFANQILLLRWTP